MSSPTFFLNPSPGNRCEIAHSSAIRAPLLCVIAERVRAIRKELAFVFDRASSAYKAAKDISCLDATQIPFWEYF
jgi:hypothetical protein